MDRLMDWTSLLVFIHVLCLVFWLGTDIGVFVLGKFAQNPIYTTDQRLLLLKVALILDMFPRVCMVLMVPTGFQLATNIGAISPASFVTAGVWLSSGLWLAIVLTGLLKSETPIGVRAKSFEKWIHYLLIPLGAWAGLVSLVTGAPISMRWLAVKVLLYVLIVVFALLLEHVFQPAAAAFMKLAQEGSSTELEHRIRKGMDKTYVWVLAIYAAVIFAAYFGVSQPGF
jgi:hypothetical protein